MNLDEMFGSFHPQKRAAEVPVEDLKKAIEQSDDDDV